MSIQDELRKQGYEYGLTGLADIIITVGIQSFPVRPGRDG